MSEIVRFKAAQGEVLVEVEKGEPAELGIQRASASEKVIGEAAKGIDEAVHSVLPAADRLFEALKGLKPNSTELRVRDQVER